MTEGDANVFRKMQRSLRVAGKRARLIRDAQRGAGRSNTCQKDRVCGVNREERVVSTEEPRVPLSI